MMNSLCVTGVKNVARLMQQNLTWGIIVKQVPATSFCMPCCHVHMQTPMLKSLSLDQRQPKESWLKGLIKRTGWLEHSKSKLRTSGSMLYESVADRIPYMQFMKELKMADTFYSWFLITELHVWMLMVRTMAEKEEGRFTRNCMLEAMWEDVTSRAKMIGSGDSSSTKEEVYELSQQFQAAMLCYDEGLLTDDKILASAVWRRLFQKQCNEPEDIECVVQYIRRQIECLDSLTRRDILLYPKIKWLDFKRELPT